MNSRIKFRVTGFADACGEWSCFTFAETAAQAETDVLTDLREKGYVAGLKVNSVEVYKETHEDQMP